MPPTDDEGAAKPSAFILRERGVFWWADVLVPATQFAPDASIGGELRITSEGEIMLDLDGFLTPGQRRFRDFSDDPELKTRQIRGLLRHTDKRVLLVDLSRQGGRAASSNVSFEGFRALFCLIGDRDFPQQKAALRFRLLGVNFDGFEEWLRLDDIVVQRGKVALHAKYHHPKQIDYTLPDGKLSINLCIIGAHQREKPQREIRTGRISILKIQA
jgi:hypothetical protein